MMAIAAAQQTNNSIKIMEKKIMQMCPENFPIELCPKKKKSSFLSTYEEDCSSRTSAFQLWSASTISITFVVSCNMKASKLKLLTVNV